MKLLTAFAAFALLLSACGKSAEHKRAQEAQAKRVAELAAKADAQRAREDSAIQIIKKRAVRDFFDPTAVQFRDLKFHDYMICGELNGKNAFGAYTGFAPFYAMAGSVDLLADDEETDRKSIELGTGNPKAESLTQGFYDIWNDCKKNGRKIE